MAVVRLADVFPAHRNRVIGFAIGIQLSVLIVLMILFIWFGLDWLMMLVVVILPVFILNAFATFIIGRYALEPLDILSRTITQVSGQPHDTTMPVLNGTNHEKTGVKLMVDTIYSLTQRHTQETTDLTDIDFSTAVLDRLPGGIIALDQERTILYANTAAPVTLSQQGQKQIQLIFEKDDTLDNWLTTSETNHVSAQKIWRRVQDSLPGENDHRRVFDIFASYQKDGDGGIDTILLLFDQTSHYAVNEDNMDFIALAAHELRGPITIIRGYLDILRPELESSLSDDQRVLFDRLDVSTGKLSGYVSNVLNASKYDRRHLKLHLNEERLSDIYASVADDLSLRASTQGRLLTVSIPDNLPTIAADRTSLSEVMSNLIDNAIKYSHEGGQINVSAALDGDFIRFSVQDFGVGMPSAVVGKLFTKFYRSHRSKANVAGTGLGLYISKAIIESHGGKISLTSAEGQGSTFSFSVPIYATVADKLLSNTGNQGIIETSSGWIKNHSMYRG
ncbi:HAMP domain-containing histidine kinase [Patescibacteria group bacterium]|nr:MAG: HAMP domain-containing histidine kinase [Patescibacteria group bacterium]